MSNDETKEPVKNILVTNPDGTTSPLIVVNVQTPKSFDELHSIPPPPKPVYRDQWSGGSYAQNNLTLAVDPELAAQREEMKKSKFCNRAFNSYEARQEFAPLQKYHFWWSDTQDTQTKLTISRFPRYCNIDGQIVEFSEANGSKEKASYPDAVYLGYGVKHGDEEL